MMNEVSFNTYLCASAKNEREKFVDFCCCCIFRIFFFQSTITICTTFSPEHTHILSYIQEYMFSRIACSTLHTATKRNAHNFDKITNPLLLMKKWLVGIEWVYGRLFFNVVSCLSFILLLSFVMFGMDGGDGDGDGIKGKLTAIEMDDRMWSVCRGTWQLHNAHHRRRSATHQRQPSTFDLFLFLFFFISFLYFCSVQFSFFSESKASDWHHTYIRHNGRSACTWQTHMPKLDMWVSDAKYKIQSATSSASEVQ